MKNYRVNNNTESPNHDHEVHEEGCRWWPTQSFVDLGEHPNCESAVVAARVYHSDANGCRTCSPRCNKG